MGIHRDEVTGGTLDAGAAWVNSAGELDKFMEQGGSCSPSMLMQAAELGSDSGELAQVIIDARNTVRMPKRLDQIAKLLERADAVYRQEHAAEIEADTAKQRERMNRSVRNRVPWVLPSPSSGTEDS